MKDNLNKEILEFGKKMILSAGQILMDNFDRVSKISKKPDGTLVTNVDIEVEREIIAMIRNKFPEHGILTEESPEVKGISGYRWVIDPLDGTHNYIRGIDVFGISVCVMYLNKPAIAIINLPASSQLYYCEKGSGAYLNGEKISVSGKNLKESCVTHNSNFRRDSEKMIKGFKKLAEHVFNIRMFGACVRDLTLVAEGRVEADIEYNIKPWDIYGGALMVEEAGGRVTDFGGEPWYLSGGPYIASNGLIHEELRSLFVTKIA